MMRRYWLTRLLLQHQRWCSTQFPSLSRLVLVGLGAAQVLGCRAEDSFVEVPQPEIPAHWCSSADSAGTAPVVVLDVGKGMAKVKASFFKIFPSGKFMTVSEFCGDTSLLGRCVLVIHGGTEHGNYIQEAEKLVLIHHLSSGGSLLTIASGSTFCGCNRGCLGLLPVFAHDRQHWNRGTGDVQMALSAFGKQCLPCYRDARGVESFQSKYFNGPVLLPMRAEEYRASGGPFELCCGSGLPFLTYQTEMNDSASQTSLVGMPAVIAGEIVPSGGRFVAVSANIEVGPSPPTCALIQALVSWASAGNPGMTLG